MQCQENPESAHDLITLALLQLTIAAECFKQRRHRAPSVLPLIEPIKRMSYRLELDIDQNHIGAYSADWNIKQSRFHRIAES